MRSKRIPAEKQYRLIMECRQSGLTDHQWCVEHDIKPGTFYNWVKRLRQKGVVVKHFCNTLFENSPGISSFKWCFPIIVGMRTDMIVPYVHISV